MSTIAATHENAHLRSVRQRAVGIHHRLDRVVTAAAVKAGWSKSDVPRMVHTATLEFFSRLSRDEAPEDALNKALEAAERAQMAFFVEETNKRGHPMEAAMQVLLERRLSKDRPKERKAIEFALSTFNAMLEGGHAVPFAIDAARVSAIEIMQAA